MDYEKVEGFLIGLSTGILLACLLKHRFAEDEAQDADRSSRSLRGDDAVRHAAATA
jgi:hypothetical protein